MQKINPDLIRLEDMLGMISEIETIHQKGVKGRTEFFAIAYCLAVIGEAARNVTKDTQTIAPGISWRKISDMRNRIIHGYGKVDEMIVLDVITKELPLLKRDLQALLTQLEA